MSPTLIAALLAAAPSAPARQVPAGTEVMVLALIPGKVDPVKFGHADHSQNRVMPNGEPLTCSECHHRSKNVEGAPAELMRCHSCHAQLGEPEKVVGGERAQPMAKLKPDGAVDYRSILFHQYCLSGCHRRLKESTERKLAMCKACHEHGLPRDAIHGRYDALKQDGTELHWLQCPAGQSLVAGNRCSGTPLNADWQAASAACPKDYRLPTRAEVASLIGCADAAPGACAGCAANAACARMFGPDDATYWTSEDQGDRAWTVSLRDGSVREAGKATRNLVRCVR